MILLVLVAHDGKTLQLDVSGQTRVDAVQQALVSVTGIGVADQVVMCHGARLDPAKPLAAYKLPVADASSAEDTPVFLYHKLYLRPGATPPAQEPLPVFEVTVPGLPHVGLRHPLHSAHSPLIRALPDYEAQFSQQLGEARAFWEASQQRLHKCRQLMSEQEVQARAADAARANVESHYNYIASIYATFVDKYVAQHQQHTALLAQFGELSAALSSVALPPQLQTGHWRVLADLQPRVKLAEWHESCSRSHTHFAQKVVELEGVFQLLRGDVERLFLQAPCVDLDALGQQLAEAEGLVEEQGSIVQVLVKDLGTVQGLVEAVVAQLGSSAGGASLSGAAVHDSCAAVDTLLEQHLHSLLPRVRACDTSVAEFLLRCGEAKACMTRDVLEQLQGIAAQQSRIRDMKHKLALLNEVLARQAAAFAELQAANRLPAAYRLALAECARRAAWREMYGAQAARLAEHCGRITAKEAGKREVVNRQLARHLPHDLLAAAGLLAEPPYCTVSLPPSDAGLLVVTSQDIARLPAAIQAAADAAAAPPAERTGDVSSSSMRLARASSDGSRAAAVGSSSGQPAGSRTATPQPSVTPRAVAPSMLASTWLPRGGSVDPAASGMAASVATSVVPAAAAASGPADLAVENARLRAELAGLLAQQAAKELGEDLAAVTAAAGPAGAGGPAAASQLLAASSVSAPTSVAASTAAVAGGGEQAAAAAAAGQQRPYGHGGVPVVPSCVTAPLPSVTAALQQAQESAAGAASVAASQRALTLGPVKAALAAKDELISALEGRVSSLSAELSSYEGRITALEAQLAAAAATSGAGGGSGGLSGLGSAVADAPTASGGSNSSSRSSLPQAGAQPQQQQQAAGSSAAVDQQSVAPAFLLDATQATSFFGPAPPAAGPPVPGTADTPTGTSPQQQQQQQSVDDAPAVGEAQPPSAAAASPPAVAPGDDAATSQDAPQQQLRDDAAVQQPPPEQPQPADSSTTTAAACTPTAATAPPPPAAAVDGAAARSPAVSQAPLSVSEPDLRGVLVAGPAEVEQAHLAEGAGGSSSSRARLRQRGSLDSAAAAAAADGSAGPAAAGGLTGLLSSSMHYLLHRRGSSSKGEGSSGGTTGGTSTPVSSPPPGPSSP